MLTNTWCTIGLQWASRDDVDIAVAAAESGLAAWGKIPAVSKSRLQSREMPAEAVDQVSCRRLKCEALWSSLLAWFGKIRLSSRG